MSHDQLTFLDFNLEIEDVLLKNCYLRYTFLVEIFEILVFSESLEMLPDARAVTFVKFADDLFLESVYEIINLLKLMILIRLMRHQLFIMLIVLFLLVFKFFIIRFEDSLEVFDGRTRFNLGIQINGHSGKSRIDLFSRTQPRNILFEILRFSDESVEFFFGHHVVDVIGDFFDHGDGGVFVYLIIQYLYILFLRCIFRFHFQ